MCPDELRQFRVLQFCHVHGHDLACSNKREREREGGEREGRLSVCLFLFCQQSRGKSLASGRALSQLTLTMRQVHDEAATMCAVKLSLPA